MVAIHEKAQYITLFAEYTSIVTIQRNIVWNT
jgi:hypothetical protein